VYPLPTGFTATIPQFGLTSSSTEFVMTSGTSCSSSTDGITWTQRAALPFLVDDIKFVNGIYFLYSGVQFATSTDLNTWTVRTSQINSSQNLQDVTWNGTVYIFVADNNLTLTSPDLINWTPVTLSAAGDIYTVAASNTGRIVALCTTSPFVRYSDDNGATWTSVTALSISTNSRLLFANNTFVFATGGSVISTSTNGVTWATASEGTRSYQGRPTYTGTFFVVGSTGSSSRSTNGSSWTDNATTPLVIFPGGAGGAGGISGGGGGGASSQVNSSSGAGGNGGNGLVRVYFW
jgi:hypothetical protein